MRTGGGDNECFWLLVWFGWFGLVGHKLHCIATINSSYDEIGVHAAQSGKQDTTNPINMTQFIHISVTLSLLTFDEGRVSFAYNLIGSYDLISEEKKQKRLPVEDLPKTEALFGKV